MVDVNDEAAVVGGKGGDSVSVLLFLVAEKQCVASTEGMGTSSWSRVPTKKKIMQ